MQTIREAQPRRAGRVIVLDSRRRVLLLRYDVDGFIFWTTPGGALEPGETEHEAAARELLEELGLTADLRGPVHQVTARFHHEGRFVENTDVFFEARLEWDEPRFYAATSFEAQAMKEVRWWTTEEIRKSSEAVFPRDLVEVMKRLE